MLKQILGPVQDALGAYAGRIPMTPNQITIMSIVCAICAAGMIIAGQMMAGILLFIAAAALDAADGMVARAKKQETKKGAFMDGVADRVVEFMFLFSLMFLPLPAIIIPGQMWIAMLIFFGTCMTSFVKAYAVHREAMDNESVKNIGGPLERTERVIMITAAAMAGAIISWESAMYVIIAATALAIITVARRTWHVLSHKES